MPRSRASAKASGARTERAVADYLKEHLSEFIDRRTLTGSKDRGDLTNVRTATGERAVIEVKDYGGRLLPAEWVREAHVEAGNDDAVVGVVVAKKRGTTNPGEFYVLMDLDDLIVLLGGERPSPITP